MKNPTASIAQTEADIGDVSEEVVLARGKTMDPCLSQVLSVKGSQCDSDSQLTGKDQVEDIAFQSKLNVFTGLKLRG